MRKALIAMSGGVDSSVAALLIKKEYEECAGANMRLFDSEKCGSVKDLEDAKSVCDRLGMPFHVFEFHEEFKKCVIERFISCYEKGITPNPCIDCNRFLKFNRFYQAAREMGFDLVVTGHYVRVVYDENLCRYLLKKAVDDTKDQSYVLYSLTQDQLSHVAFPLGEMTKDEARKIAAEHGFINASKKDSQDICFVPDGDYGAFIRRYTGKDYEPGDFVDEEGKVVGQHKGIIHYTVGQRKGLGVSADMPYYVARLDLEKNQVVLTKDNNKSSLELVADGLNWIAIDELKESIRVKAKIRYKTKEQWATVSPLENGRARVVFDEPQRAITCGQAVVFYDEDTVVGGGTIVEV